MHFITPCQLVAPGAARCVALVLAATVWAGGALALPTCEGNIGAIALKPLPEKMVVALDNPSPTNKALADRFLVGLRTAGVTVGTPANVLLHISTARIGDVVGQPSDVGAGGPSDMSGIAGANPTGLPPMPDVSITAPPRLPSPPSLFMRVEATEAGAPHVSWVATLQCRIVGMNDGQRAEDIGHAIGGILGQRIERHPF